MIKRVLDFIVACILLVLLSPLMLFIGALIRLKLGSPVLFVQERPGLFGKPFNMIKFRTMSNRRDHSGMLLPSQQRRTPFGDLLRSTSLDELPELVNVLRGEMSLVGPRPLLMDYLPRYSSEQARRHDVRPGITGWAQVNGRNLIGWEQRFALDLWYVDNQSLFLDLRILILTVWKVIARKDINAKNNQLTRRFGQD